MKKFLKIITLTSLCLLISGCGNKQPEKEPNDIYKVENTQESVVEDKTKIFKIGTINKETTNIYKDQIATSEVISTISKDQQIVVVDETLDFYIVDINETEQGYIPKEDVDTKKEEVHTNQYEEFQKNVEEQDKKSKNCDHDLKYIDVFEESTCTKHGFDLYTCTKCGRNEIIEKELKKHTIVEVVETEPTETKAGTNLYKCTVCDTVVDTRTTFLPNF